MISDVGQYGLRKSWISIGGCQSKDSDFLIDRIYDHKAHHSPMAMNSKKSLIHVLPLLAIDILEDKIGLRWFLSIEINDILVRDFRFEFEFE